MRVLVKSVGPAVVAVAVIAAVAVAAPVGPTTPYPNVPANPDVCQVEKLEMQKQQAKYDLAKANYDRAKLAFDRGVGSAADLRAAEAALDNATIALNNAKYAEAACRNSKGNDANKVCIGLSLELNRLIDEAAQRRELERLARAEYDMWLALARQGVASAEQVATARAAWQLAQIERQQVEQKITDQRAVIAGTPACRDFPPERPTPTSTTPTSAPVTPTTPLSTTAPANPTTRPAT